MPLSASEALEGEETLARKGLSNSVVEPGDRTGVAARTHVEHVRVLVYFLANCWLGSNRLTI